MPSFTAPDGTELAYRAEGEGEPLICLPGGPMRAGAYLGGLGGLARRRRLVVPDPRGTGGSGPCADPAGYRCDRQAGDVEALRAHLGLDRIDLLAHSAAGDLAVLYAARHPERVRSLVLVTARGRALGVDFTEEQRREAAALRAAEPWYPQARDALDAVLAGTATDAQRDAAGPLFYGRWDAAAQTHATAEAGQTNEEAARAYAAPGAFDPPAARAAVAGLHAPVLAVAGELDGGPLPRVAAEIAGLFPRGETAVLPGAGHYPWLDAPEDFARTVGDFLDREAAAAAGADFPPALAELAAAWTPGGVDFEMYRSFEDPEETAWWFRLWTGNPEADGREYRFFGKNGGGGYAGLWLVREGRPPHEQPVVYFESEGEVLVVAPDLGSFLWLLAQGVGPHEALGWGEAAGPDPRIAGIAERHAPGGRRPPEEILDRARAEFPHFEEGVQALCR